MKLCGNCKHFRLVVSLGTTFCDLSKKDGIGHFAEPCEYYEDQNNQEQPKTSTAMESYTTPAKVCKICGRALPLDSFPKHPRTKDGHGHICAECLKAKNASSIQAAIDARKGPRAQVKGPSQPAPQIVDKRDLADYTDADLYEELKRRGWAGTLTRTETLGPEF